MSANTRNVDDDRLAIERERLLIEKMKLRMLAELIHIQRQAERRASRSLYERFEDALFDW